MRDWQPIETAPKDGTYFIGAGPLGVSEWYWKEAVVFENDEARLNIPAGFQRPTTYQPEYDLANQPTHWMPWPDPPGEAK